MATRSAGKERRRQTGDDAGQPRWLLHNAKNEQHFCLSLPAETLAQETDSECGGKTAEPPVGADPRAAGWPAHKQTKQPTSLEEGGGRTTNQPAGAAPCPTPRPCRATRAAGRGRVRQQGRGTPIGRRPLPTSGPATARGQNQPTNRKGRTKRPNQPAQRKEEEEEPTNHPTDACEAQRQQGGLEER